MPLQRPHVFVDIETTGLSAFMNDITEVACIRREITGEEVRHLWYPEHSLVGAQSEALTMTRYDERIAPKAKSDLGKVMAELMTVARDATLVGASPTFDLMRIEMHAHEVGVDAAWHHRAKDVENLVANYTDDGPEGELPSLRTCAAIVGVEYDREASHGAMYDAELTMKVFDAVVARWKAERR